MLWHMAFGARHTHIPCGRRQGSGALPSELAVMNAGGNHGCQRLVGGRATGTLLKMADRGSSARVLRAVQPLGHRLPLLACSPASMLHNHQAAVLSAQATRGAKQYVHPGAAASCLSPEPSAACPPRPEQSAAGWRPPSSSTRSLPPLTAAAPAAGEGGSRRPPGREGGRGQG